MKSSQIDLQQQIHLCLHVAKLVRANLPIVGNLGQWTASIATPVSSKASNARASSNDVESSSASSASAGVGGEVERQLSAGKSLADALAGDSSRDSQILAACITAGESSGVLDQTLEDWAGMYLDNARATRTFRAAMLYPSLLMLVTFASLSFVIWKLIPEYESSYAMFSQEMPGWLNAIVYVREHMLIFSILLALGILLPVVFWIWRRQSYDAHRIPREPARRLRLESLASSLTATMVSAGLPLNQVAWLSTRAMHADKASTEQAFARLTQQRLVVPLPREVSLLLASLHAGMMHKDEAVVHLRDVARHLQQSADLVAARNARWLPMLVALSVGAITIATYVFLIYMPWIALLTRIVSPEAINLP